MPRSSSEAEIIGDIYARNGKKFSATCLQDLMSPLRDAGRKARKVPYIVACEASDGSWCEFDADSVAHAKVLADNAVDKLGARGCSCWRVELGTGELASAPSVYNYYAPGFYE
jgi:hypothetical protein